MTGELFSKLKNKWHQFVWDYLINNKSSILLQECSKELVDVHNNIIKGGDGRMTEKKFKYRTEIKTEDYDISFSIATCNEQLLSEIVNQFGRISINKMQED